MTDGWEAFMHAFHCETRTCMPHVFQISNCSCLAPYGCSPATRRMYSTRTATTHSRTSSTQHRTHTHGVSCCAQRQSYFGCSAGLVRMNGDWLECHRCVK